MLGAKDRNARGQGQEPRTQTQVFSKKDFQKKFLGDLQKKQKKIFKTFFQAISTKNDLEKFFSAHLQNFNRSKNSTVLEPRTGQFSRT